MSGERHDWARSLDEALNELERTDPAVAAAAESLERAKQKIIEGRGTSPCANGLCAVGWVLRDGRRHFMCATCGVEYVPVEGRSLSSDEEAEMSGDSHQDDPDTAHIRAEDARWAESLRVARDLNSAGRGTSSDERCACGRPLTDAGACSLCEYVPERCNCVLSGRVEPGRSRSTSTRSAMNGDSHVHGPDCEWSAGRDGENECLDGVSYARTRTTDEEQARLDNHYGYCTLPPDHDGPCAAGEHVAGRALPLAASSGQGLLSDVDGQADLRLVGGSLQLGSLGRRDPQADGLTGVLDAGPAGTALLGGGHDERIRCTSTLDQGEYPCNDKPMTTTTVLLIQTDDGNTIAVSFPSVAAARDWEDEHEMELGTVIGTARVVSKTEARRG